MSWCGISNQPSAINEKQSLPRVAVVNFCNYPTRGIHAQHNSASPDAAGYTREDLQAFLDADAMSKWLPPNGFTGKVHHLDAKVGGTFKMSFTNFTNGQSHSFGGEYLELVPHERLRYTDKFDDPNLLGEIQVTITLKQVSCGTELKIVQEGVPDVIPSEACYLGWQESLILLAKLVEAEIPG